MTPIYTGNRDIILEALGWSVVCESPYEIEHEDGSSASGQATHIVVDELMTNWKDYLDEDEIETLSKKLRI